MPINGLQKFSALSSIVPSDSVPRSFSSIYVGTGGDVRVLSAPGTSLSPVIFKNVPSGTILPIQLLQGIIFATGTTALDLIGLN